MSHSSCDCDTEQDAEKQIRRANVEKWLEVHVGKAEREKKLQEARSSVRRKLEECLEEERHWTQKILWAHQQVANSYKACKRTRGVTIKFVQLRNEILRIAEMKNPDDLMIIRDKIRAFRKLGVETAEPLWQEFDISSRALSLLLTKIHETSDSLQDIINSYDTMTLEQLEIIEFPTYDWAVNNFCEAHFKYNPDFEVLEKNLEALLNYFVKFIESNRSRLQNPQTLASQEDLVEIHV